MKICNWQDFQQRCSPRVRFFHVQIYGCFLLVLFAFSLLVALLFWAYVERTVLSAGPHLDALIEKVLPADASAEAIQKTLQDFSAVSGGPVALYRADGSVIAASGEISAQVRKQLVSRDPRFTTLMRDGRIVIFDWHARRVHPNPFFGLLLMALLAALGTWPLARYLSRRIEALRQQADALAQGDLSARAEVHGCDEIAQLANRFNQAAERIEALVNSQRTMLASASHELRSPLARIRMASSLIGDDRPELQQQIVRDIAELDVLIGDLLLASRLSSDTPQLKLENIDLLGLAAEEANRVGASLCGEPVEIQADARLLRHLLRNLLENSRRHAAGSPVEIRICAEQAEVVLRVRDSGPGVPETERERIFEPFYRPPGTAETGEGAGYGLALVRRIARLHGGDVVCLPCETGACFELRMPVR